MEPRNMLNRLALLLVIVASMLWSGTEAQAQTLVQPPPIPPGVIWTGNFPGDPGGWPGPDEACDAQRLFYNPGAIPLPATYDGGRFAACNWLTHSGSGTILPAIAVAYCPAPFILVDPGFCGGTNRPREARPQCDCVDGAAPPGGSPSPTVGNPIALNHGAKVDAETDYESADGRFVVERTYYSVGEDYPYIASPTPIPGFGGRWHGVVPGRLAVSGSHADQVEYLNVHGGYSIFKSDEYHNPTNWNWHSYGATRRRLSMVGTPAGNRQDFFFTGPAVPNGAAEVRMEMSQGEYILFRRAAVTTGPRYLVPVEHGYADGYKLYYTYPGTGEFPSTVRDSLGREMTLTWAEADRQSYASLATSQPIKVISEIALPDGTRLHYGYGYGTDLRGARIRNRLESVRRVSGSGALLWARSYLYESAAVPNGLTGKVDQNGNRLSTYSYDAAGQAASTELAGGADKYTIVNLEEQERANFVRQVTNPLGHRTDYVFFKEHDWPDAQRVLSTVREYPDTGVAAASTSYQYYGYVGDLVIANYTDERQLTRHHDIDSQRRPTLIREASGTPEARTTHLTWHPVFDLVTHEERPGLSIDYTYSPSGLLLTKTETDTTTQSAPYATAGQTRTWTYGWNGNGRLLSVNGPKGLDVNGKDDITTFAYDTAGNLLTAANGLGHQTQFTDYDANGRPGKMTDPNGIDTLFAYDALGRLTSVTVKSPVSASDDRLTTLDYDVEGRVTGITSPGTQKISIDYDLAGRVIAIRDASGDRILFTRDPMGNVTAEAVKRPDGTRARAITRTFDGLGRLLTETLGPNRTTTLAYDSLDNVTSITSARSFVTTQAFDPLNRLISSVAPDTGDSRIGYDLFDRSKSFTDPHSVQTFFVRNGFGEVIREVSPDRGTSIHYYDAAGDLIASVDGRGQRIDLVRDALGRILSKTPVGRPASEVITYGYDTDGAGVANGIGRLLSVQDGTGKTQLRYDFRGNLLAKRMKTGALASASLAYTYDIADRIQSITYPSGRIVTYAHDQLGRATSVTTRANAAAPAVTLVSGITYEPLGSMLAATYGNGLSLSQSWGNDARLASKRLYPTAGGADLSSLTYSYDNDDNIVSIADGVDPARTITYGYDPVDRLTRSDLASGSIRRQDFIHDTNGNRIRVEQRTNPADITPVSTATYTLTPGTNQLASVADPAGTRTIAYDGRGNTIGETRPGETITVGYDGYGRLTRYQTAGSAALLNDYNGLDERVSSGTSADMRRFVYDSDGRLMGEYGTSAADVKAETIWLSPEVESAQQPFGGDDGVGGYAPLAVATGGGNLYWVHGNHLGVPIVVTDGTGNPATPSGYTRIGFPGQTQTLADLYYNRYRDYDPTTGRYIQADPIGLAGGGNPYLYANANPLKYVDPDGRNSFFLAVARGSGAAALLDISQQMLIQNRSWNCIDRWEVAGSALLGGALYSRFNARPRIRGVWAEEEGRTPRKNSASIRREWEAENGRPWPIDLATGKNQDVAHNRALADGGTNQLDNIKPMANAPHRQEHIDNGDFKRWGARSRKR
jgi:RHS repeat-associated protein